MQEPEKLQGNLKKRGEKNKSYKNRWFQQRAQVLEYYPSKAKAGMLSERRGVIALEDVARVSRGEGGVLQVEMKRGERTYFLKPENASAVEYWEKGLEEWLRYFKRGSLEAQVQVEVPQPQAQQRAQPQPQELQMSYAAPVADKLMEEELHQLRHTVKQQQQTIDQLRRQMRAQAASMDGPPEAFEVWQAVKGGDTRTVSTASVPLSKLRLANTSVLHVACELGDEALVRLLVRESSLLDQHDDTGKTPLLISIEYEHIEIAKLLLKVCDASLASKQGVSPLHAAVINQDQKMVSLLLKHHASIDAQDERLGWTPLMYAASLGDLSMAKLLLKAGADKEVRSTRGHTAHVVASREGHMKLADMLQ